MILERDSCFNKIMNDYGSSHENGLCLRNVLVSAGEERKTGSLVERVLSAKAGAGLMTIEGSIFTGTAAKTLCGLSKP